VRPPRIGNEGGPRGSKFVCGMATTLYSIDDSVTLLTVLRATDRSAVKSHPLQKRHKTWKSKHPATVCPQTAKKRRFLNSIHRRGGCREDHRAYSCTAGPCNGKRSRDDCLGKEGSGSVGLRGAELLTFRAARIVMGATVFVIGVLTGAGIAAWVMPPI
jgi:hypothetical protein